MMHQLVIHESIADIAHVIRNKIICMSYCSSRLQSIIEDILVDDKTTYTKEELLSSLINIVTLCRQCEFYRCNINDVFENYVRDTYLKNSQ